MSANGSEKVVGALRTADVPLGDTTAARRGLLVGRRALVTGASRGIGREIARALAIEGADVIINYRSSEREAEDLALELERLGTESWTFPADVSDHGQVQIMHDVTARSVGPIDVLVNNAGVNVDRLFKKMDRGAWDSVISTNLTGAYNTTRIFLDDLIASGRGRIINITSIVGQMGNIGQVNYAASKAGVIGMTKALAKELARHNVTVNAIAPGFIETDMVKGIPALVKLKILEGIPMRRFGLPEEVAHAAVFLASDHAAYITGHVMNVNGGMYL
jgi:3-oxoacyl-[acyl-carrier protein] reductase